MFSGSQTVGTRDASQEREILDRQDQLRNELEELRIRAEAANRKVGKINRRIGEVESELLSLKGQARELAFLGQFSFIYSEFGATGLNANSFPDMTIYFVNIPSNRLEGWFWMESDRLHRPVFREFDKEVAVVHEERRLRIDSSPTGALDEEVRRMFWGSHPYSIGPQGLPEDVDRLNRPTARGFFQEHYGPENLTAALVGGFDPDQVKTWAQIYFGGLESGAVATADPSMVFASVPKPDERRLEATCDCSTQAQVHYPSVAFGHPDAYALDLLAGILNGRTGRLYRSLVLHQEIAFSAYARQKALKQAGQFSFLGETKGDVLPSDLVEAWDQEVALLKTVPATDEEISRAMNRLSADAFRSLKDPFALMSQLLYYQGLGDWRHVVEWSREIHTISATDLQRVARQYLDEDARIVALYQRRGSASKTEPAAAP